MKPETRNPKPLLPRHVLLNTTLTVLLLAYALPSTLAEPLEISVTGSNFQWHIVYPGPDGKLDTEDDLYTKRHPRVPVGIDVSMKFTSMDYVYTLLFPQIDRREVAVPEITWDVNFSTRDAEPGEHVFKGDQMCGYSHTNLIGVLTVHTVADFEAWLGTLSNQTAR